VTTQSPTRTHTLPAADAAAATPRRFFGPEERRQYETEGFIVLRHLLRRDELDAIVEWLRDVARRRELPSWHIIAEPGAPTDPDDPLTAVRKFQALPNYPEALRYFGAGTPAAEATRELLSGDDRNRVDDLRLMFLSCFAKPAGHGTETPWHQDQGLWPIWNPAATSCWVAIDECTPENGCLEFLRGSHRGGIVEHVMPEGSFHPYIPEDRIDPERVVQVPMQPGDAVFFDGRVLHYSPPNRSDRRRLGMVAVYSPDADLVRSIDISDWANNRIRAKQQLGSGEAFYQERVWVDAPRPSPAWQPERSGNG
jgi:hypothetical protein